MNRKNLNDLINQFFVDKINSPFYMDNAFLPDVEKRVYDYLYTELYKFFNENNVNNLNDWIKYLVENNDFKSIVELADSYYYKVFNRQAELLTVEEQFLMYGAIVLYAKELDVEIMNDDTPIKGMVINRFIEILKNYDLVVKGLLKVEGTIMISDLTKFEFYSTWNAGNVSKQLPITLS